MSKYEITVECPDGDWRYWRGEYKDFQAACEAGIARIKWQLDVRLIRVERLPDAHILEEK